MRPSAKKNQVHFINVCTILNVVRIFNAPYLHTKRNTGDAVSALIIQSNYFQRTVVPRSAALLGTLGTLGTLLETAKCSLGQIIYDFLEMFEVLLLATATITR